MTKYYFNAKMFQRRVLAVSCSLILNKRFILVVGNRIYFFINGNTSKGKNGLNMNQGLFLLHSSLPPRILTVCPGIHSQCRKFTIYTVKALFSKISKTILYNNTQYNFSPQISFHKLIKIRELRTIYIELTILCIYFIMLETHYNLEIHSGTL